MHRLVRRLVGISMVALSLLAPAWASAEGEVTTTLTAHRVTRDHGKESFASADKANPGDVVEYRATYRNAGDRAVRQVAATLPIPAGTAYVPGTASPPPALASLDGRTFAPLPLKRRVRLDDGREVEREVPATEYRWLRWTIPALDPRASRTVRARVRVEPVEVAAAVRR